MEILFENVYTDTEESMMELYRQNGKGRRWFFIVLFACYTAFFLIKWGTVLNVIMFFFCAGYAAYLMFLPRINTKRYFNQMKQYYDGVVPETHVICSDEDITVWFGKDCNHLVYDKITKIYFYENIIILQAGKAMRVTLLQDAFTKGTKEGFIEFLREKCPNAKFSD